MQRADTDFCGILSNINFYRILAFREIWIHNVKPKYEIRMWKTTKYHLYFYSVFSLSFSRIRARWDDFEVASCERGYYFSFPAYVRDETHQLGEHWLAGTFISRIRARWDLPTETDASTQVLSFPVYVRDETSTSRRRARTATSFHFPHTCEMRLLDWNAPAELWHFHFPHTCEMRQYARANLDAAQMLSFPAYVRDETIWRFSSSSSGSFHFPHTCEMRLCNSMRTARFSSFISRIRARWDSRYFSHLLHKGSKS